MNPHATQLHKLSNFRPRIGLGYEQDNVAIPFRPNIGGNVAVADGHGIIFVGPER